MDDQKKEEDRWRETLELLGVSEQPPAAAKSEPPPKVPEIAPIKAYEEPAPFPQQHARIEEDPPRPVLHEEPDAPTIPMTREEPMAEWEAEFEEEVEEDTSLDDASPESQAEVVEGPDDSEEIDSAPDGPAGQTPAAGDVDEDGQPRRGRRRRRRGRRRGGPDKEGDTRPPPAAEGVKAPPASPRPPRDAEPDSRDRRGRRPGRQRDDEPMRKPPIAVQREEVEPEEVEETRHERSGPRLTESDTDFSDWNVPSWQDLISSLYRPDR